MKASKRKKLEAAGWKVGSAREFLGLSDEEVAFVEPKLTLSASLKEEFGSWSVRVIATKTNSLESISNQTLSEPVVELFRVINLPDHLTILLPYQETECTKQWINQPIGYSIRN